VAFMPPESDIISLALTEDIGSGDVTSAYFTSQETRAEGRIVARESCIVAGLGVAEEVFRRVDANVEIVRGVPDGTRVTPGNIVMVVRGRAASLLTAERTALNFLQRLSGVATLTGRFVDAVSGTSAKILDTRKTTPGLRRLEKAAVVAGGATNHRFGLHDMVMVKDNHLAATSSLEELQDAISRVKAERPDIRVELEADTLEQVRRFVSLRGVDVILLDNMTPAELREAVSLKRPGVAFEASGGVNLETVRQIAETGVDFISVGEMTHSARAVDLTLEVSLEQGGWQGHLQGEKT
jgi:nicotinate-nucleotide pyrophosphorylase (carboxylating)